MIIETYIVNAFTDKAFSGNPAGVCVTSHSIDKEKMQQMAAQLNLSETAFILKKATIEEFLVRFFTPKTEVDFCGHASLASAKLLLEKNSVKKIELITKNNLKLVASRENELIKMLFPLYNTIYSQQNHQLLDSLGIKNHTSFRLCEELGMLLIEVPDKKSLVQISPDYQKCIQSSATVKEVVITTKSEDDDYDFYSRCFCPWIGIDEDPVTGAAHSVLAKYWSDKLDKTSLSAYQLSKRGGFLKLKILSEERLEVLSQAQIVLEGIMKL
jgi:PhzF family phenazine biosynthesis protein